MTEAEDFSTSQNIYIFNKINSRVCLSVRLFENPDHKDSKIKNCQNKHLDICVIIARRSSMFYIIATPLSASEYQ